MPADRHCLRPSTSDDHAPPLRLAATMPRPVPPIRQFTNSSLLPSLHQSPDIGSYYEMELPIVSLQMLKKAAESPRDLSTKCLLRQKILNVLPDRSKVYRPVSEYSNLESRGRLLGPAILAFPPRNLGAKCDFDIDWWETHSTQTSMTSEAVTHESHIKKAPRILTAVEKGQMPMFETDVDGRLINENTRDLVFRELMSRSTLTCGPKSRASETHRQFASAAGFQTSSNSATISACAANSFGSTYSSPSSRPRRVSLSRLTCARHAQIQSPPPPEPTPVSQQPDWSALVDSWTNDDIFELTPKETLSNFQSFPASPSSTAQIPCERHSGNQVTVPHPTHRWTASSEEEAGPADCGCSEAPGADASTSMEQQWSRVQNSEHAQLSFIKTLFARKASQDSVSELSAIETGSLRRCESSRLHLDVELAAVTSPPAASPYRTTSDDLHHCFQNHSCYPHVAMQSPPSICSSSSPFRPPKILIRSLTVNSIHSETSTSRIQSYKRSLSDRVRLDWLEDDVSQGW